jgi:tetratricopeptide (TPR) repeat protein
VRLIGNLGLFYLDGHAYQAAYRYLQQRALQPLFEAWVHIGDLLVALGDYSAAQQEYAQGLALVQTRHMPYWESWLHDSIGRLHRLRGDPVAAQSACRLALSMAQKAGNHFIVQRARINLGHALADQGDLVAAGHCLFQRDALVLSCGRCSRGSA